MCIVDREVLLNDTLKKLHNILLILLGNASEKWTARKSTSKFLSDGDWAAHLLNIHDTHCSSSCCCSSDEEIGKPDDDQSGGAVVILDDDDMSADRLGSTELEDKPQQHVVKSPFRSTPHADVRPPAKAHSGPLTESSSTRQALHVKSPSHLIGHRNADRSPQHQLYHEKAESIAAASKALSEHPDDLEDEDTGILEDEMSDLAEEEQHLIKVEHGHDTTDDHWAPEEVSSHGLAGEHQKLTTRQWPITAHQRSRPYPKALFSSRGSRWPRHLHGSRIRRLKHFATHAQSASAAASSELTEEHPGAEEEELEDLEHENQDLLAASDEGGAGSSAGDFMGNLQQLYLTAQNLGLEGSGGDIAAEVARLLPDEAIQQAVVDSHALVPVNAAGSSQVMNIKEEVDPDDDDGVMDESFDSSGGPAGNSQMGIETEDGNFIDISNISGDEAAALSTVQKKTKIKRAHKCEICKRSYGTEFQLQRHMQEHLKETACSNCSEVFNSSEDLDLHVVEKHAGKLYLCQECGLQFTTLSACSTHRLGTHFKSGKMPCPISSCKKIFSRSGRLEDHLNFHAGTKSHVCSICSKGFHTRDSVVKHEKSCGRPQPEVAAVVCICSECGKTYNNVTNLVDHVSSVHKKIVYACICGATFSWRTGLARHKRRCVINFEFE